MQTSLCLKAQHLPVKRDHKRIFVHSSVRIPVLQAKNGLPPGAARVAVVGAGVVLACTLGAMYWKGARAMQAMAIGSNTMNRMDADNKPEPPKIKELPALLSEIRVYPKANRNRDLTELFDMYLRYPVDKQDNEKDSIVTKLERRFQNDKIGHEEKYHIGMVLILAMIKEKSYVDAVKICGDIKKLASRSDPRPQLFLAIITMMKALDSMEASPNNINDMTDETKGLLEEAWKQFNTKPAPLDGEIELPTSGTPSTD